MSAPQANLTAPLAGMRILDLTRLLSGPAATMHLADYGADVIKIEDTGEGEYMRDFAPQVPNAEGVTINPAYEATNRGKRSLALDLKQPRGRELLLALVESADVTEVGPLARIGGHALKDAPAPRAGEHACELLSELGLDEREIAELVALGVVRAAA